MLYQIKSAVARLICLSWYRIQGGQAEETVWCYGGNGWWDCFLCPYCDKCLQEY